jgi:hypothetical protein
VNDVAPAGLYIDASLEPAVDAAGAIIMLEQAMDAPTPRSMDARYRNAGLVRAPPVNGLLVPAKIQIEHIEARHRSGRNPNQWTGIFSPQAPKRVRVGCGAVKASQRRRRFIFTARKRRDALLCQLERSVEG